MTIRVSTAVRNMVAGYVPWKRAFTGGELRIFTGSQPAAANDAQTGTLLVTLTQSSGARTAEVYSSGSFTLTGSGGQVDNVTIDSKSILPAAVPFNGTLAQTATDLANAINAAVTNTEYIASASGAVLTITALPGSGATPNGFVVAATVSGGTLGTTSVNNMASGVTAVNGLKLYVPSSGVLAKDPTQVWSGVAVAGGVAGWFRLTGALADAGGADSSAVQLRLDGNIATSGADMTMANTTIVNAATQTLNTFAITVPA